jgi:hypothetical protein
MGRQEAAKARFLPAVVRSRAADLWRSGPVSMPRHSLVPDPGQGVKIIS